jgi:hypothetical protein
LGDSSFASGIIPSAILNAAMIPGWPGPVKYLPTPPAGQLRGQHGADPAGGKPSITIAEMVTYLANLGAFAALLDRARQLMKRSAERRRLLL